ncbi:hypothetical protein MTR_6g060910 [Medicago truncatula]|uniref:Uncharacterized protein n=1 Tax=Medicago truncatula TaxID=3880 RepID=G7KND9_MEDTR|nr:hypothetical protein MTR_6g060910 [Medicago truncatula]
MDTESFALLKNGTWTLVDLPHKFKPVGSKWSRIIIQYNDACRVIRYLRSYPKKGLFFLISSNTQLLGFTDVDRVGCVDTRRSITGLCFFICSSLISWRTKKQNIVSRSSSEAEYRALSVATCEM